MTTGKAAQAAIEVVLAGNIARFLEVSPDDELFEAASTSRYVLSARGVVVALQQLGDGRAQPEQVQAWASFVRRGYLARDSRASAWRLDIEYESSCEDVIADAVGRMDELGDEIDGEISENELLQLLDALRRCSPD